eukprot:359381_1
MAGLILPTLLLPGHQQDFDTCLINWLVQDLSAQDLWAVNTMIALTHYEPKRPNFIAHGKTYYVGDLIKTKANDNEFYIGRISKIAETGRVTVKRTQNATSTQSNHRSNNFYVNRGKYKT